MRSRASDPCNPDDKARAKCLRGLHRAAGALARALPALREGGERVPDAGWVPLIRQTSNNGLPAATFESGELTLQNTPMPGEEGRLHEQQTCGVLPGRG